MARFSQIICPYQPGKRFQQIDLSHNMVLTQVDTVGEPSESAIVSGECEFSPAHALDELVCEAILCIAKAGLAPVRRWNERFANSIFVQMLRYKCLLYGKVLVILDERDTSKTCSTCGHKQKMPLWKRTYRCINTECRLVMDRDENSAVNILKRYLARLGPHTDDSVRCADVFTAINDYKRI